MKYAAMRLPPGSNRGSVAAAAAAYQLPGRRPGVTRRCAMWPDERIQKLFGIDLPILQAPMGRFVSPEMVIAVSGAGGLGGLGLANSAPDKARADLGIVRQRTSRPINVNFMCHRPPKD